MMDDEEDDFPCDPALENMMERFYLYERAIAVWLHTDNQNDKAEMERLSEEFEKASDEWFALQ